MIPPIPPAPTPPQHTVDRAGDADGEALHAASEPRRRIRLDQQVEMIGLDAELEDAERVARGGAEGASDCGEKCVTAKRWQPAPQTERDVDAAIVSRSPADSSQGLRPGAATFFRFPSRVAPL